MISSLLLKEWLKLKWFFFAVLLLNLGACTSIFFDIRQQIHAEHAEMVWYQAIHIKTIMYDDIRFFPLFAGLTLALSQFIPEMQGRRMRIALHLPTGRNRMLLLCLLTGMFLYSVVCLLDGGSVYLIQRLYFPQEVALSSISTMAPWFIAGLLAYFCTITVLLETTWSRRIFLFMAFSVLVAMLYQGSGYGWFIPALGFLSLLIPLGLLCVFESGRRFQQLGA